MPAPKFSRDTVIRLAIAVSVSVITWRMTVKIAAMPAADMAAIPAQWQAVFLMVVGYYFKDRPEATAAGAAVFDDSAMARRVAGEVLAQFALAILLLAGSVYLFAMRQNGMFVNEIAGAWVAAVMLALAFYFTDVAATATTSEHDLLRSILAATVMAGTVCIYVARMGEPAKSVDPMPLQWITVTAVVIAFYFAKKGDVRPSAR
jgi:hypothetical protein